MSNDMKIMLRNSAKNWFVNNPNKRSDDHLDRMNGNTGRIHEYLDVQTMLGSVGRCGYEDIAGAKVTLMEGHFNPGQVCAGAHGPQMSYGTEELAVVEGSLGTYIIVMYEVEPYVKPWERTHNFQCYRTEVRDAVSFADMEEARRAVDAAYRAVIMLKEAAIPTIAHH